jgi:hypothetical protein
MNISPQDSAGSSALSQCYKTKMSPNKDMQLTQYSILVSGIYKLIQYLVYKNNVTMFSCRETCIL